MTPYPILYLCLWAVAIYIGRRLQRTKAPPRRLPPGPKPLPILGNILDFPRGKVEYYHWLELKDKYGPVSSLTVQGRSLVIIHDRQVAIEILENQASKSSGRCPITFTSMCGYGESLPYMPNHALCRRSRKIIHQELRTNLSQCLDHVIQVESRRLLSRLLKDPQALVHYLHMGTATIILRVVYGYSANPHQKDLSARLLEQITTDVDQAISVGSWMVDLVPWLRFLPSWLPGMNFKTVAKISRKRFYAALEINNAFSRNQIDKGWGREAVLVNQIKQETKDGTVELSASKEYELKWLAISLSAAAFSTTNTTLTAFYLAMTMFPQVQKKAQEEIDAVIGSSRLPNIQDKDQLPYMSAIVKETLRWFPATPMMPPHMSTEDIHHEGYFFPKGTIFIAAIRLFLLDPERYPNPSAFEPERFLPPRNEPSPLETGSAFGFGRRICPAIHMSENILFSFFFDDLGRV